MRGKRHLESAGPRRALLAGVVLLLLATAAIAADEEAAAARTPCIRNVRVEATEERIVAIYDLAHDAPAAVRLVASTDGGESYGVAIEAVEGDVGPAVAPGRDHRIVWDYRRDHPQGFDDVDLYLDIVAAASEVPTYAVVRLRGSLGAAGTTEPLLSQLSAAAALNPSALVLELQSPGGRYTALEALLDRITAVRQAEGAPLLVGLVRQQALHAASLLASALDKIYLMPRAELGGASEEEAWGRGQPPDDLRIYPLAEHKAVAAAEKVGRNPALVRAMAGSNRDLYLCGNGPQRSFTHKPWKTELECRLLVGAGGRLRLDAEDAVEFGLADGIVSGYEALGEALGYEHWVALDRGAPAARKPVAASGAELDRAKRDYEFLLADLRDAASSLRDGGPRPVRQAADLVALVRRCAEEIQQIRTDYPALAPRIEQEIPRDLSDLVASCEDELQSIRAHRRRYKY